MQTTLLSYVFSNLIFVQVLPATTQILVATSDHFVAQISWLLKKNARLNSFGKEK